MKKKIIFAVDSFWKCRVKRFRGYWGCIRKQLTTPYYNQPVDEVIKRFKTQREATIYSDMVNVRHLLILLDTDRTENCSDEEYVKAFVARRIINDVVYLTSGGYKLSDLVLFRDYQQGLYISHKCLNPNGKFLDIHKMLAEYTQGCKLSPMHLMIDNYLKDIECLELEENE